MTDSRELEDFVAGLRELVLSGRTGAPALQSLPAELAALPHGEALPDPGRLRALGLKLVPCLLWQRADGSLLPLALRAAPGRPKDWAELIEQARRQAATAEPPLEELARCLKHSLAAPLHGQARLLESLLNAKDPGADFHRLLALACQGAQLLAERTEGLIGLLRIESGELDLQVCDLSALCRHLLVELEATGSAPLPVQIEPGMRVRCDAQVLRLALRALLTNALKFGRSRAQISLQPVRGYDVLCVEDDGAGFDCAHSQGLFKPFERLHLQSEFPGLGLGLATVRAVALRHGGWAWCDMGRPGHSAFLLALPRAEPGQAGAEHA